MEFLFLSGPNRAMQPRCAMRFESHTSKSLAMQTSFSLAMRKKPQIDLISPEKSHKNSRENPAMLACDAKNRHVFKGRAMRNACDSDSRCGLACDASTRDATSLAMRVERCQPLSSVSFCLLLRGPNIWHYPREVRSSWRFKMPAFAT